MSTTTENVSTMQPSSTPRERTQYRTARVLDTDKRRTLFFVAGAVACLAITAGIELMSRPAPIKEFGKVGEEFYSDFIDPTLATALEVYAFNAEQVKPLEFRVQRLDNGRWVIPSHHNYPADAEDQLAKTASSIIGIERGAMVTRWSADHARYGVVNPKQDSLSVGDVEGIGKRITLRGDDDSVLADYIVGNQIEGATDQYYVRHPDEDEVYIAALNIDLSTKFTDWIDTELLDLNTWDTVGLTVNDYSFDELQGKITESEVTQIGRKSSSDPWKIDGLDDEVEKINEDAVRETNNAIADLNIVGVRPKQLGLTPDLRLDRDKLKSQNDIERLQADLLTRGFLLQPGENGDQENLRLVSREGELYAATDEGLVYRMYFGRAFAGSQDELEIGLSPNSKSASDTQESEKSAKPQKLAASSEAPNDADENATSGTLDELEASEELNTRFADWYYVIPGDSFDKLRLTRADFVKAKEKDDDASDDSGNTIEDSTDVGKSNQADETTTRLESTSTEEEATSDDNEADDEAVPDRAVVPHE